MLLLFGELRRARQQALALVEIRTKYLRQLEESGAAEAKISQARQDLEEALSKSPLNFKKGESNNA